VSEENADDKLEEQTEKEGKVTAKSNKEKEDGEKVESKQVRKAETKDDKILVKIKERQGSKAWLGLRAKKVKMKKRRKIVRETMMKRK
jgi:hypothetical protein